MSHAVAQAAAQTVHAATQAAVSHLDLEEASVPQAIMTQMTLVDDAFNTTGATGSLAFWVAFLAFMVATGAFFFSALVTKSNKVRSFSVTNCAICAIAMTSYFAMSNGQGYSIDPLTGRQNYWARYIDWFFTTPLILLDITHLCGVGENLTYLLILMDIIMIVAGLFATLTLQAGLRWSWFMLGNIAFVPILYLILVDFQRYKHVHAEIARVFDVQVWLLAALWIAYPIVWFLGIGTEAISVDMETVLTAFLDITAKAVFGSLLLGVFRDILPYSGVGDDTSTDQLDFNYEKIRAPLMDQKIRERERA